MDTLILLIPGLIVFIIFLLVYGTQAKPKNGILFGLKLTEAALQDERIAALQNQFRQAYRWYAVAALLGLAPLLWLGSYFSLSFIYFFLWIAGVIYTSTVPFKGIHHKAVALKRDEGWFVGKKRYITVEKDINRLAAMKPWSPYWFALPAVLSIPLIALSISHDNPLLRLTGFASLVMTGVLLLLSLSFTHGKPRAYSRNPVATNAIHHAARRYWSIFWLLLAVFEVFNAFIAYNVLSEGTMIHINLWMGGIAMVSLVPLLGIYYVHNRVKELEYRFGSTDGKGYYAEDDDLHWRHGLSYYNPQNKSVMVPKRVGTGSTVNLATKGGKRIYYGSFIFAALVILPVTFMMIRADSSPPELRISDQGTVSIKNTEYAYSFELDDIKELTLEDAVPTGFRTNGIATSAFARGNFKLAELGPAKLYIFKKTPPYIMMKLDDLVVIYNDEEPVKTRALYAELKKQTGL
ncbi:DUF5808 domain-containing protein [Paenibacillus paeoniae]|uniref:DUF5808 domain-containing protein n=1 Tax=Paenibacillus paeoniae TaxID=2292705 RepID=A0A371P796_9BACL|nr:DUF5808 domain-containing protein [Paenibacillus paeoniae]REK71408.1 hypothetical protein DX130_20600 [Paenibacillus paeoniae]